MFQYRLSILACLTLSASFPGTAATVFWPFGFHFPDRAHHYAGGLSAALQPAPSVAKAETDVSPPVDLQIAFLTDAQRGGMPDALNAGYGVASSQPVVDNSGDGQYSRN